MRVAAGILMIIVGLMALGTAQTIVEKVASTVAPILGRTRTETVFSLGEWMLLPVFLSLGLTLGGGISTFRRKHWWWALSGAICSMFIGFFTFIFGVIGYIFLLMGILALIFLIKSKGQFQ